MNLKDFINEAFVNEAIRTGLQIPEDLTMPHTWDLVELLNEINGKVEKTNYIDWEDYIDIDIFKQAKLPIKYYFSNASILFNAWTVDLGNVDEGAFSYDDNIRDEANISGSGYALHADGDDGTWSIFEFKKKPNSKEKAFAQEFFNRYDNDGMTIVEEF